MRTFLAIVGLLAGTGAFLMFEVLCMAGSANASPRSLAVVKTAMWGMLGCWLASMAAGVWALVGGRPMLAAGIGGFPVAVAVALIVIAWVTEF